MSYQERYIKALWKIYGKPKIGSCENKYIPCDFTFSKWNIVWCYYKALKQCFIYSIFINKFFSIELLLIFSFFFLIFLKSFFRHNWRNSRWEIVLFSMTSYLFWVFHLFSVASYLFWVFHAIYCCIWKENENCSFNYILYYCVTKPRIKVLLFVL